MDGKNPENKYFTVHIKKVVPMFIFLITAIT